MPHLLNLAGRLLIALLFLGGAIQKLTDPAPVTAMIASFGPPGWLIRPVAAFGLAAAIGLVRGPGVLLWAPALAACCVLTSRFHRQLRADPWQVTIAVKSRAIAGGPMSLAAEGPGRFAIRGRRTP